MALAPESAVLVKLDEDDRVVSEETISSRLVHHEDLLKVSPLMRACSTAAAGGGGGGGSCCRCRCSCCCSLVGCKERGGGLCVQGLVCGRFTVCKRTSRSTDSVGLAAAVCACAVP